MANANRGNVYYKPSGKKVSLPSRNVMSKQTAKSEEALGKAMDTGKGRGPLRGVARRSRTMADLESGRFPSQDVAKASARSRARTAGKIVNGKLVPPTSTPVKRSTTGKTRIGPLARGSRGGGMPGGGLMDMNR